MENFQERQPHHVLCRRLDREQDFKQVQIVAQGGKGSVATPSYRESSRIGGAALLQENPNARGNGGSLARVSRRQTPSIARRTRRAHDALAPKIRRGAVPQSR